jgi:two-component system, OmpR family, sensor histidine kinase CiaH
VFRKTRIWLVVLNSIVFFLILNGFGISMYLYMQHRLNSQVDITLTNVRNHLAHEEFRNLNNLRDPEDEAERRIVYLLWDRQGSLTEQIPRNSIYSGNIPSFQTTLGTSVLQTVVIGNRSYRVLNVPIGDNQLSGEKFDSVATCQLIYNLQPENEMLDNLLMVIGFGAVVSIVVAFLAGLYLAGKALIPIQLAWNKQQQFVSDASHELRTPLSVIKLHLERLFRHPGHTIEQESQHISEVIRETKRMTKIVTDLLTLARSDSHQMQIKKETVRMDEILTRTIGLFQEAAMVKDITLSASITEPLTISGDEERLQQLIVILLDNAVKYTKENGLIKVKTQKGASQFQIEIEDTGIGISKEDLPFIFDRFFRGDRARTRTKEGIGLGLSIAKWITEVHGGEIQVFSQQGIGTRFLLTFPSK